MRGRSRCEFRAALGNRIYGCDDCLAVCPWNKFAQTASESAFHARDALRVAAAGRPGRLDDAAFRALFSKSPVKRIGRDRFVRNVLYAIGNCGDPALATEAGALARRSGPGGARRGGLGGAAAAGRECGRPEACYGDRSGRPGRMGAAGLTGIFRLLTS